MSPYSNEPIHTKVEVQMIESLIYLGSKADILKCQATLSIDYHSEVEANIFLVNYKVDSSILNNLLPRHCKGANYSLNYIKFLWSCRHGFMLRHFQ